MRLQILIHNDQSMIQVSYTPPKFNSEFTPEKGWDKGRGSSFLLRGFGNSSGASCETSGGYVWKITRLFGC